IHEEKELSAMKQSVFIADVEIKNTRKDDNGNILMEVKTLLESEGQQPDFLFGGLNLSLKFRQLSNGKWNLLQAKDMSNDFNIKTADKTYSSRVLTAYGVLNEKQEPVAKRDENLISQSEQQVPSLVEREIESEGQFIA